MTVTRTRAQSFRAPSLRFELQPQRPFRLDLTAWALRRRVQNTIDLWDGRTYRRALLIGRRPVVAAVTQTGEPDAPRLEVTISARWLAPSDKAAVTQLLTVLLGLEIDLACFYARADADAALGPLARRYRGLKPPRFSSLFECLLNAVASQQLSLVAGLTVLGRFAATAAPAAGSLHPFPAPGDVLRLSPAALRQLGFSGRKARTILQLARAADEGELALDRFEPLGDDAAVRELVRRPGIGRWSADYVLLRGLGRLHVFPQADIGALGGLRRFLADAGIDQSPSAALACWQPDGGMLYFHLLLRGLEQRGALAPRAQ